MLTFPTPFGTGHEPLATHTGRTVREDTPADQEKDTMRTDLEFAPGRLYYGDCLEVMQEWPEQCIDLVYLDPPFNSKTDYNILYGGGNGVPAQVRAFADTWHWDETAAMRMEKLERAPARRTHDTLLGLRTILGHTGMLAYLTYMAERLEECRRIMREHASVYLHCDPNASHYLKIVCDGVFGADCFTNELVWYYKNASRGKKRFAKAHDVIFWYSRTPNQGQFNREDLLVPFTSTMTQWRYQKGGQRGRPVPRGKTPDDVIELPSLNAMANERLGYPTQKPVALLRHIIRASSSPGDVVLDPFCGCGTTIEAADREDRKWVGIDLSPFAVKLVRDRRLRPMGRHATIAGVPTDLEGAKMLLARNPLDFEAWAVASIPGLAPNERRTGDRGIDGRGAMMHVPEGEETRLVVAQVKGSGYAASAMRDFKHVVSREKAAAGVYITLHRTTSRNAVQAAAEMGSITVGARTYPKLQLWSVEQLIEKQYPELPDMADPYTGEKARQASIFE